MAPVPACECALPATRIAVRSRVLRTSYAEHGSELADQPGSDGTVNMMLWDGTVKTRWPKMPK